MLARVQGAQTRATNRTDQPDSLRSDIADQSGTTDQAGAQTGSDDFFASVCSAVFGKDAGLHLSLATGVPERSCYRYAAGQREVPVLVLRAVLHSDKGRPFLCALMQGCDAAWWIEMVHAVECSAAYEEQRRKHLQK